MSRVILISREELEYMVLGFTRDEIPDYQMSAFIMAAYLKGMDEEEMRDLTLIMIESGYKVDLSAIPGKKVDKHSTGGVGDTTSLLIGPIISACGVPFAKMSGRGLAHTGGTLDKLESIPGMKVNLTEDEFVEQVKSLGIAIISPTGDLAPADKKMYALRDVTATVDSIPLIAGSIMSKKLAAGADVILLDVKTGDGAFMTTIESARELARALVKIGKMAGKATRAVITDMNQPLSTHIGNALEVKEVIETLKDPARDTPLRKVALELSAHLLEMGGYMDDLDKARQCALNSVTSGQALEKLRALIKAQGGDPAVIENTALLPAAGQIVDVAAAHSGYLASIKVTELGVIARDLGAGRICKEDCVDPAVGLVIHHRVGDGIEAGEPLVTLHAARDTDLGPVRDAVLQCFSLQKKAVAIPPLILDTIS